MKKRIQSISTLFWLNRQRLQRGKATIYLRVSVQGKRIELATPHHVAPDHWDNKTHTVKDKDRQKTNNPERVPLLPMALEILEKYANDPYCVHKGRLLPVYSNQKYNAYLKEVARECGIAKYLITHTARHTFATTITLEHDVPLETVSQMFGHKSIRTTQVYAKITHLKISNNMRALKEKLKISQKQGVCANFVR